MSTTTRQRASAPTAAKARTIANDAAFAEQIKREAKREAERKERTRRETTQAARGKRRAEHEAAINQHVDGEKKQRRLEEVLEACRRLKAHGDPNGKAREPAESNSDVNRHRRANGAEVGFREVDGRMKRKLRTTADNLEEEPRTKAKHLPKHLRVGLDAAGAYYAEAQGVVVDDRQSSGSARMVSSCYEGTVGGGYGPRDIPQRVLDACGMLVAIERAVPPEMQEMFIRLLEEEVGVVLGTPESLQKFGREYGWNQEKQAGAAGGMLAIATCAVVTHAIKQNKK